MNKFTQEQVNVIITDNLVNLTSIESNKTLVPAILEMLTRYKDSGSIIEFKCNIIIGYDGADYGVSCCIDTISGVLVVTIPFIESTIRTIISRSSSKNKKEFIQTIEKFLSDWEKIGVIGKNWTATVENNNIKVGYYTNNKAIDAFLIEDTFGRNDDISNQYLSNFRINGKYIFR